MSGEIPIPPGRLPEEMLARFDQTAFAIPSVAQEASISAWEARWRCHVVTYRTGCLPASGERHLCTNAYAADLDRQAQAELNLLEHAMAELVLVAYERPWRFRG